jgi:hypothetical protein
MISTYRLDSRRFSPIFVAPSLGLLKTGLDLLSSGPEAPQRRPHLFISPWFLPLDGPDLRDSRLDLREFQPNRAAPELATSGSLR